MPQESDKTTFEKRVHTMIQLIITGLFIWIATTVNGTEKRVIVLSVKVANIKDNMTNLKNYLNDEYTKRDASKDLRNTDLRINNLKIRVANLEKK